MKHKVLVIHPTDPSTDFLKAIYQDQTKWTVLNKINSSYHKHNDLMDLRNDPEFRAEYNKVVRTFKTQDEYQDWIYRWVAKLDSENQESQPDEVINMIKEHDEIIMLGHGTPMGLLGGGGQVISSRHVPYLKDKKLCAVWCNAHAFITNHRLKAFYTGMIISETTEARFCGIDASIEEVREANYMLAEGIKQALLAKDRLKKMKEVFTTEDNGVILYNQHNLFQNDRNIKKIKDDSNKIEEESITV